MTTSVFTELTQDSPDYKTAALGVDAANPLTANDIGKLVKYGPANNVVLTALDESFDGRLISVNPDTVNDGFALGTFQANGRMEATVDAAEVGAIAIGALVGSGTQTAAGVAGGATVSVAAVTKAWQVIRHVSGTGVAGDTVLIEKV